MVVLMPLLRKGAREKEPNVHTTLEVPTSESGLVNAVESLGCEFGSSRAPDFYPFECTKFLSQCSVILQHEHASTQTVGPFNTPGRRRGPFRML